VTVYSFYESGFCTLTYRCGYFHLRLLCFKIWIKREEIKESFHLLWWARITSNEWMVMKTHGCTKLFSFFYFLKSKAFLFLLFEIF
jgi:hypothetical protein